VLRGAEPAEHDDKGHEPHTLWLGLVQTTLGTSRPQPMRRLYSSLVPWQIQQASPCPAGCPSRSLRCSLTRDRLAPPSLMPTLEMERRRLKWNKEAYSPDALDRDSLSAAHNSNVPRREGLEIINVDDCTRSHSSYSPTLLLLVGAARKPISQLRAR